MLRAFDLELRSSSQLNKIKYLADVLHIFGCRGSMIKDY